MIGLLYGGDSPLTALVVADSARDPEVPAGHVRVIAYTLTGEGPTPPRVVPVADAPPGDGSPAWVRSTP